MRQAGRSQPEYRALRERYSLFDICKIPDLCAQVTLRPVEELGVDAAVMFADITLPLLSLGVGVDLADGGPQIAHPVRTEADVAALRPFEIDETTGPVLDAIGLITASAAVPLIGFAGAPFTIAGYLVEGGPSRDFLVTKALMHTAPDVWEKLMDRLAEMTGRYLLAQISAGVQAVQLFDSWAGCLSPADYVRYVAPHSRRVFAALADTGVPAIHFATGAAGLLKEMVRAGGDVIGVDWRIGLGDAWETIGYDRGIQGNLDPAVVLASVDVIRHRAHEVLRQAGGRPGHIFNLGHGVWPQTPRERLRHLVEVVHAS